MTTITEEALEAVSRKKVLAIVEDIRVSPQCSGSLADWICGVLAEEIKALPALVAPQAEGRDTGLWREWTPFNLLDLADETIIDVRTKDGRTYPHQPYFNFKDNGSIIAWRITL